MTELCVVIVTLAILAAVALPALAGKDRAFSIRTQCANQLRQIGVAVTAYARNNGGYVLSAWPNDWAFYSNTNYFNQYGIYIGVGYEGYDQHFLWAAQSNAWKSVNLYPGGGVLTTVYGVSVATSQSAKVWVCPSINYLEAGLPFGDGYSMWGVGYAYMGAITSWRYGSAFISVKSLSPVQLSSSNPYWVLAADLVVDYNTRVNQAWAIGGASGADVPHVRLGTNHPDGGNQLDADGSVAWAKLETMVNCNCEAAGCYDYIYQRNLIGDAPNVMGKVSGLTFAAQVSSGYLSPQRLSASDY